MLELERRTLISCADASIVGWKDKSVNELCNLYVKNENNELLRQGYFSAIFLKKWGYIGKNYTASKASGFTIEDCYDMVLDAILYTLKKRKWLDPECSMYKDKNGPDKILNRCIYSSRQLWYYNANCAKRATNYGKSSLTEMEERLGDHSEIFADNCADITENHININTYLLVNTLFNSGKIMEGIILDNILNDDCFSEKIITYTFKDDDGYEHKTSRSSYTFKLAQLVNNIYSYDNEKIKRLATLYSVDSQKITDIMQLIKTSNKNKLHAIIKALIIKLKNNKSIKEAICC